MKQLNPLNHIEYNDMLITTEIGKFAVAYCEHGHDLELLAKMFGRQVRTIRKWLKLPEFEQVYQDIVARGLKNIEKKNAVEMPKAYDRSINTANNIYERYMRCGEIRKELAMLFKLEPTEEVQKQIKDLEIEFSLMKVAPKELTVMENINNSIINRGGFAEKKELKQEITGPEGGALIIRLDGELDKWAK